MNNFITLLEIEQVRELIRQGFVKNQIEIIHPEMLIASGFGDIENSLKILRVLSDQKVLESVVQVYKEEELVWSGSTDEFVADQLGQIPGSVVDPALQYRLKFLMSPAWKEAIHHTLTQEKINEVYE